MRIFLKTGNNFCGNEPFSLCRYLLYSRETCRGVYHLYSSSRSASFINRKSLILADGRFSLSVAIAVIHDILKDMTDDWKEAAGLYKRLTLYSSSGIYPFHMPGHKRNPAFCPQIDPFRADITEIDGFDDLHDAEGILLEIERKAAALFGAEESRLLVNGSTAGILSAVCGSVPEGGTLVMARNCHCSAYHAAELRGIHPVYVMPHMSRRYGICGSITASDTEAALRRCETAGGKADAVLLTSPTYDGVVSNIRDIASVVHAHGIPLIVDEAHGPHFCFHPYFPESALSCGADLVIQSLHKTLPSMTQTALLHMQGGLADRGRVSHYLDIFQSSSPSYILMGSIDYCLELLKHDGKSMFETYTARLKDIRSRIGALPGIRLTDSGEEEIFDYDKGKLLFAAEGRSGAALSGELLLKYALQMEMAGLSNVLAMTSVCDTEEGFSRLFAALSAISESAALERPRRAGIDTEAAAFAVPETVMTPGECSSRKTDMVRLSDSAGRIAAAALCPYPPGIPLAAAGERLTPEIIDEIQRYHDAGLAVRGETKDGLIAVVHEE